MGCRALEARQRRLEKRFGKCLASLNAKVVVPDAATRSRADTCKCSWGADTNGENVRCSALEALELAQRQRLGKLEHARHVLAAVCELVVGQAAGEMGAGKVQNVKGR